MGRPKRVLHARGSSSRREPCFINIKRENDVESSFPFRKPEPKKIAERRSLFHAVVAVIATRQSSSKSEEPSCRQASVHEKNFGRARACRGSKRACKGWANLRAPRAAAHHARHPDSRASTLTGPEQRWCCAMSRRPAGRRDAVTRRIAASSSEASSAAPRALAQARRVALRRGPKARRMPPPRHSRAAPRVQRPSSRNAATPSERKRERRPNNATLTL